METKQGRIVEDNMNMTQKVPERVADITRPDWKEHEAARNGVWRCRIIEHTVLRLPLEKIVEGIWENSKDVGHTFVAANRAFTCIIVRLLDSHKNKFTRSLLRQDLLELFEAGLLCSEWGARMGL